MTEPYEIRQLPAVLVRRTPKLSMKPARMTLLIVSVVFLFLSMLHVPEIQASSTPTVQIQLIHSRDKYPAGGTYPILFQINIADGWNIHGIRASDEGLIPTRLSINPQSRLKILGPDFPDPHKIKFEYTDGAIEVYAGEIIAQAWLQIDRDLQPGRFDLIGEFSYQACSESVCRRPETISLNFPIEVVGPDAEITLLNQERFVDTASVSGDTVDFLSKWAAAGFWVTLLGIFLGGLALNLTPCVYPLIPITVSYFGGKSQKIKGTTILHAALYLTGLALTNSILGVSAALSGGMLGAVLQKPIVLVFIAIIMVALALSFFGVWELRMPQALTQVASKNYKGYFGTFFMGLTLGIVAAPCLGPFILGLLTYVGRTGDPVLGFIYFFVLSIGMGLPLCILAVFSGGLERLPKSGEWMIWIRKLMGWVLVAVAAYIIKPLIPPSFIKDGLIFFVLIIAGIHLGWLDHTGSRSKRFSLIKKVVGLALGIAGVALFLYVIQPKPKIAWTAYNQAAAETSFAFGRPVILDFYADWCLPCKELDHRVFSDSTVIGLSQHFTTMRMDLTQRQPQQDDILQHYEVRGVPTVLFFDADGHELTELRVRSFIHSNEFVQRMKKALSMSSK